MKRVPFILALLFIINTNYLIAQTNEELEEYFNDGQFFFNRGDFEDALSFYAKLLKVDSLNANYNFKIGESYLNIPGKEDLAIPYFKTAITKTVSKQAYKKKSFDERAAPLHAYFYLGNAYRMNNQLNEALESYMKFIDSPYFHNNYNINVVDREIKSCERAKVIQDAPLEYELVNLGEKINSDFSEEKPVISADGNSLVFIRRLKFYDAIFYSFKEEGEWQQAININPQLLSDGDFYPTGLSANGKELLLIKKEGDSFDIYRSKFDGEVWSVALKAEGKLNSISTEAHASYGLNDNQILITSDRKGGKGGFDIWVSEKQNDGSWGNPKNLGKQINTELDEQVAYLSLDNEVLFFSSQGHYTMGGYDIFYSRKIGNKWRIPTNIGFPVNNTRDNLNYCPSSLNCRQAYLSVTKDDGFGAADIYLIHIKTESTLSFRNSRADN